MDCWARSLRDCAGGWSREHFVSKCLFDKLVRVQGFPWCLPEPKIIPINELAANILCSRHNSLLSPLDLLAKNAFGSIREFARLMRVRTNLPRQRRGPWNIQEVEVDGAALERWCIKTTLNMLLGSSERPFAWRLPITEPDQPPGRLVQAAFGQAPLTRPLALYSAARLYLGLDLESESVAFGLACPPSDDVILGAFFVFHGLRFVLWLNDDPPPDRITRTPEAGAEYLDLSYHVREIRGEIRGHLSQVLSIRW